MTIYDLKPGVEYEVLSLIEDFHDNIFHPGQRIRFIERHYLPHDDGHTVIFKEPREFLKGSFRELRMYLQGTDHMDVVDHTERFLRPVEDES